MATRTPVGRIRSGVTVLLFTVILVAIACTGSPAPTPAPSPISDPTNTPVPTQTPYPTYTPAPTYTPYPTLTPMPYPTYTPRPTITPRPTYAIPTPTPAPQHKVSDDELVSSIITCLERDSGAWEDLLNAWAGGFTEEYKPEDIRLLLWLFVASEEIPRAELLEMLPECDQLVAMTVSEGVPDPSPPPIGSLSSSQNREGADNSDNEPTPVDAADEVLITKVIDCMQQNPDVWASFKQAFLESLRGAGVAAVPADVTPEDFRLVLKFSIGKDPTTRSDLQDLLSLACGQPGATPTPEAIGKYYKGHTLHISVADVACRDELRWTTSSRDTPGGTLYKYKLATQSDENELVLMRIKVENHTVDSVAVDIGKRSAELRDARQNRYFPIDVSQRAQPADATEDPADWCNFPFNPDTPEDCVKFLWNPTYEETQPDGRVKTVQRPQQLPKGTGLDGWMVFEVPRDAGLCSLRWLASDTITVDFQAAACSADDVTPLRTS